MHHPTDRIAHTTVFVTPVVEHWLEREIAQWIDPTTHRPMSECFYHGATSRSVFLLMYCKHYDPPSHIYIFIQVCMYRCMMYRHKHTDTGD